MHWPTLIALPKSGGHAAAKENAAADRKVKRNNRKESFLSRARHEL